MKRIFSFLTVFVLAFCLSVPTFAYNFGSDIPFANGQLADKNEDMETWYASGYTYAVLYWYDSGDQYYIIQSTKPMEQNPVNGYVRASESLKYVKWYFNRDSMTWDFMHNGTLADGQEELGKRVNVYWASYDFLDYSGNLIEAADPNFFPPTPLAEMVLEVTEEELVQVTIPNLVGGLKILVPCGVGCLALLAVLKLFGKRSLIFRS